MEKDKTRSNWQYHVEVEVHQAIEVLGTQFVIHVRKVKVQTTMAQRRKSSKMIGIIEWAMLEFHKKIVEVLIAGSIIWSMCMAFSRTARMSYKTKIVR